MRWIAENWGREAGDNFQVHPKIFDRVPAQLQWHTETNGPWALKYCKAISPASWNGQFYLNLPSFAKTMFPTLSALASLK
jgi:hypothetical protein